MTATVASALESDRNGVLLELLLEVFDGVGHLFAI